LCRGLGVIAEHSEVGEGGEGAEHGLDDRMGAGAGKGDATGHKARAKQIAKCR